ncbi:hypothetical protein BgiBS90_005121 [Biomphalaria glabrata]|nr:hypothetical protein BgiBS90_005121 [Biomphalaria glabrata]
MMSLKLVQLFCPSLGLGVVSTGFTTKIWTSGCWMTASAIPVSNDSRYRFASNRWSSEFNGSLPLVTFLQVTNAISASQQEMCAE